MALGRVTAGLDHSATQKPGRHRRPLLEHCTTANRPTPPISLPGDDRAMSPEARVMERITLIGTPHVGLGGHISRTIEEDAVASSAILP
jgi:hypothetical protein